MEQPVPTRPSDCLAGGGDMGALMRAFDWTRTPLGAVERWPQSLRTAVRILLASGYPMSLGWGADYTFLYNDAYRPILGTAKHPQALGASVRDIFREIWDLIGPMFDNVMARGEATWREDQLLPLDRYGFVEECYFTFSYSAVPEEDGRSGGVFVTCIETTGRVLGERRMRLLRELGAAVAAARSEFAALDAAMEILGRVPHDVPMAVLYRCTEQGPRLYRSVGTKDADGVSWPVERVAQTRTAERVEGFELGCGPWPEPCRQALAVPLVSASHERVVAVLVLGISPRLQFDDGYRGFLDLVAGHVSTGISNGRAYEEERRRADQLADLDRTKTAFFTNVSHEFRTPLTLLVGPLEDELNNPALPRQTRDNIAMACRNANRLLRLVNTLLDFSRLEAGRVEAVYEPVALDTLTRDLASVFRTTVERAGLQLTVDCQPISEPVYVDVDMWEKIVFNLLSNAFKFTMRGQISVQLREEDRRVVLEVSDTGVGIPAAELGHLFDRFHRLKDSRSRSHEGTGIGLALVKELAALHGGTVSVTSLLGHGSSFVVTLPLGTAHLPLERIGVQRTMLPTAIDARAWVDEAERWLDHGERMVEAPAPSTQRILVAEDNADMRDYVSRLLGSRWQVTAAENGQTALESALAAPPDVVVADVMMPVMDGFQLLSRLRADARTRDVPVVMLSARAGEEARLEGLDAGADDYLVKPFSGKELMARVGNQLTLQHMRREVQAQEQRARRLAEREQQRTELERQRLYGLFQQAPALICLLHGPDHVVLFANPAYRQAVGQGRPLEGRPLCEALPELRAQGFIEILDDVYRTGVEYKSGEREALLDMEGKGEFRQAFFNLVYLPTRNAEGVVDGIFVHAVEVTAQVQARRKMQALADDLSRHRELLEDTVRERTAELEQRTRDLEAANAQLQELDRLKSEFLASVSHELRTPLNAIIGFSDLLLTDAELEEARRTYVQYVHDGGLHLLALVNDILDLARIEAGRVDLQPVTVPLPAVVGPALEALAARAEAKRIETSVEVEPCEVPVDPARLRQILLNLVSNALKFTPEGGHVAVRVQRQGEALRVAVEDTGVGIDPKDVGRLFHPFEQLRPGTDGEPGTGLGLAICHRLVEAHGGHIDVRSTPGQGSLFTVVLPLAAALPPA